LFRLLDYSLLDKKDNDSAKVRIQAKVYRQ